MRYKFAATHRDHPELTKIVLDTDKDGRETRSLSLGETGELTKAEAETWDRFAVLEKVGADEGSGSEKATTHKS